jgi:hypothetical protein
MEAATTSRVVTEALIENLKDLWEAEHSFRTPQQVRHTMVSDAVVDTSATFLSLPASLVRELGLERTGTKRVSSSSGPTFAAMHEAVRLTIQGRSCTMDVLEVPDRRPCSDRPATAPASRPRC